MAEPAQTLSGDAGLVLPEFDEPPREPIGLLRSWLAAAVAYGVREPHAAVLSTADTTGRVSSRVLLVKQTDERGLQFTSSTGSRKGQELAASAWASLTFYWRETLQQLAVQGRVETLTELESDALFAERPRAAQATSAVSRQSSPLLDESELRVQARALLDSDQPIARSVEWTGYRLVPQSVEFWQGRVDRLHRRLRYDWLGEDAQGDEAHGGWTHRRLQP